VFMKQGAQQAPRLGVSWNVNRLIHASLSAVVSRWPSRSASTHRSTRTGSIRLTPSGMAHGAQLVTPLRQHGRPDQV
jgi:hypothetical protein